MSDPTQIEGQPAPKSNNYIVIVAAIAVIIILYLLINNCDCGKGRMFDPVIADLPIPGSFNPNSPSNQLKIGEDLNYNGYLGTKYGSV